MKPDLFEAPDYYKVDDLLTDEHKLIRNSVRDWVKKSVSPIIEEHAQKAKFPNHLLKELESVQKDRENDPGQSTKPDAEQKHDMGEISTKSPIGSK